MKKLAMVFLAAACGDNTAGPGAVDASDSCAAGCDAPNFPDGPPEQTFGGSVSFIEMSFLAGNQNFGQGILIGATFSPSSAPSFDESPGSPLGCKVWEVPAAAYEPARLGMDEGPVAVTITGDSAPVFPACSYVPTAGYICPDPTTASAGGSVATGPQGTAVVTVGSAVLSEANTAGRYLQISGAANATNNGAFPIVAYAGPTGVVIANPGAVVEMLPTAATTITVAGAGPIPSAPDPGFLADDAGISVEHTTGGGNHIPAFTATGTDIGNDFDPAAVRDLLQDVPLDGAAFDVDCGGLNCAGGSAQGSILLIQTSDGDTSGTNPYTLPAPATKSVQLRCATLPGTAISVPAAASAYLMTSGATRIRASYSRVNLLGGTPAGVSVVAGHGALGMTNPLPN